MKHFTIKYDEKQRKLTIFKDGKVLGGMIGPIAHERYLVLKEEMDRIDVLKTLKNEHKTKAPKI